MSLNRASILIFIFICESIFFLTVADNSAASAKSRAVTTVGPGGGWINLTIEPLGNDTDAGALANGSSPHNRLPDPTPHTSITGLSRTPATFRATKPMIPNTAGIHEAYYRDQSVWLTFTASNANEGDIWDVLMYRTSVTPDPLWTKDKPAAPSLLQGIKLKYFNFNATGNWGSPCYGGFYAYIYGQVFIICTGTNGGNVNISFSSQCYIPGDHNFTVTYNQSATDTNVAPFILAPKVPPEDTMWFSQGLPDVYDDTGWPNDNQPTQKISQAGCAMTAAATALYYHGERFGLANPIDPVQAILNFNSSLKYDASTNPPKEGAFKIERNDTGQISEHTGDLDFTKIPVYYPLIESKGSISAR